MSFFELDQYYFDLQKKNGEIFFIYSSLLKLGILNIPYTSIFQIDGLGKIKGRQTLKKSLLSNRSDNQWHWENKKLKTKGVWSKAISSPPEIIWSENKNKLSWTKRQINGPAELSIGSDFIAQGWGYSDNFKIKFDPWQRPFSELRWGRFLADDGQKSLVWIVKKIKKRSKAWLWSENKVEKGLFFDEEGLSYQGGQLSFNTIAPLKEKNLFKTIFSIWPNILGGFKNQRYLSRAQLLQGSKMFYGWAIYELLDFS